MNRLDFSTLLAEAREKEGVGKNELCRRAGFDFHQFQRLETGANNFKMDLVFKFLDALEYCIYIQDKESGQVYKAESSEDLLKWFKSKREATGFMPDYIAEKTGFSGTSIRNVYNKKQTITIDLFLAMSEAFQYNIHIKTKQI